MGLPTRRGTWVCMSRALTPHPLRRPLLRSSAPRKPHRRQETHPVALDKAVTSLGPRFYFYEGGAYT